MSSILLVDDEINPDAKEPEMDYMWNYAMALREAGHEVTVVNLVDDALKRLRAKKARFDLIVLDIMMPPGVALAEEAHLRGMRTGIHLALRIAKRFSNVAIIILTNSHDEKVQRHLGGLKNVKSIVYKDDKTPFEFAQYLDALCPKRDQI
jgi:CheY-like chemotaxis protein